MDILAGIDALRDRANQRFDAGHDFCEHTAAVWEHFVSGVGRGTVLRQTNAVTGTSVSEQDLVDLARPYRSAYILTLTFQHFVSLFESFLFDFLRLLLHHNPHRLAKKQVEVGALLGAPDVTSVLLAVIDRELNELKYAVPKDWFDYANALVRLGCPTADEVETVAEIKASRDILVHNAGVVNAIYVRKAGAKARHRADERLEITPGYHQESWVLLRKVVNDLAGAARSRLASSP